jgi:hypothetical protein
MGVSPRQIRDAHASILETITYAASIRAVLSAAVDARRDPPPIKIRALRAAVGVRSCES